MAAETKDNEHKEETTGRKKNMVSSQLGHSIQ
jgi:hypothetical protein